MSFGSLLDKFLQAFQDKKEAPTEKSSKRSYSSVKNIPPLTPPIPPKASVQRKADVISKEFNKEVKHTDDCSSQLDFAPQPYADLIPSRVYRWTIKNYASLAQKMQQLSKQKKANLPENISVISASAEGDSEKEEKKQDDLWLDMMKSHEERHFRLGRITNFFS